jgi:uncharacterized protein YjbI with pentapeptide repeats
MDFRTTDFRAEIAARDGETLVFKRCTFAGLELRDLDLPRVVFEHCVLDEATFRDSSLDDLRMISGSAVNTDFSGADLAGATFTGTDLSRTTFTRALLTDVTFMECRLIGANLTSLRGLTVNLRFQHCNLGLASLKNSPFRGAQFTETDLTESDLGRSDLRDAVFTRCRLRDTDFTRARLTGADLRSSDLGALTPETPLHLRGATISPTQATQICTALGLVVLE